MIRRSWLVALFALCACSSPERKNELEQPLTSPDVNGSVTAKPTQTDPKGDVASHPPSTQEDPRRVAHLGYSNGGGLIDAIAVDERHVLTENVSYTLSLWNVESGELVWTIQAPRDGEILGLSHDGKVMYAANGTVWFRDVEQGAWIDERTLSDLCLPEDQGTEKCSFYIKTLTPDRRSLVVLDYSTTGKTYRLVVFSLETGAIELNVPVQVGFIEALTVSADGKDVVISVRPDRGKHNILRVSLSNPQAQPRWSTCEYTERCKDSLHIVGGVGLANADRDHTYVFDPNTFKILHSFYNTRKGARLSPDGKALALPRQEEDKKYYGSEKEHVTCAVDIVDTETGKVTLTFTDTGCVEGVRWLPSGEALLTFVEGDPRLTLWSVQTGQRVGSWPNMEGKGHIQPPKLVLPTPDGTRLLTLALDGGLLWNLQTEEVEASLAFPGCPITSFAVSSGGARVAIACNNEKLFYTEGDEGYEYDEYVPAMLYLAELTDNQTYTLKSIVEAKSTEFWSVDFTDTEDGLLLQAAPFDDALEGHVPELRHYALDGTLQNNIPASTLQHRTLKAPRGETDTLDVRNADDDILWRRRLSWEAELTWLSEHGDVVVVKKKVSCCATARELSWISFDASTGRVLHQFEVEDFSIYKPHRLSPDGRFLVMTPDPGQITLVSTTGNHPTHTFDLQVEVTDLAWSPDSTRFYSSSKDATISVWDISDLERPPLKPREQTTSLGLDAFQTGSRWIYRYERLPVQRNPHMARDYLVEWTLREHNVDESTGFVTLVFDERGGPSDKEVRERVVQVLQDGCVIPAWWQKDALTLCPDGEVRTWMLEDTAPSYQIKEELFLTPPSHDAPFALPETLTLTEHVEGALARLAPEGWAEFLRLHPKGFEERMTLLAYQLADGRTGGLDIPSVPTCAWDTSEKIAEDASPTFPLKGAHGVQSIHVVRSDEDTVVLLKGKKEETRVELIDPLRAIKSWLDPEVGRELVLIQTRDPGSGADHFWVYSIGADGSLIEREIDAACTSKACRGLLMQQGVHCSLRIHNPETNAIAEWPLDAEGISRMRSKKNLFGPDDDDDDDDW